MRLLVTGAAGFVGRQLWQALQGGRDEILGTVRSPDQQQDGLLACDLADRGQCLRTLEAAAPTVIVHAAGSLRQADERLAAAGYLNTVTAALHLIEAALRSGVKRIIHLSSNTVYGTSYRVEPGGEPAADPRDAYARSKRLCETLFDDQASRLEIINLRLPTVLGPGKATSDVVTDMIRAVRQGKAIEIYGTGRSHRQFIDTRDLADLVRLCAGLSLPAERRLTVPVVGKGSLTIAEIARQVIAVHGKGESLSLPKAESPEQWVDPRIARQKLGYESRHGLADTIAHLIAADAAAAGDPALAGTGRPCP